MPESEIFLPTAEDTGRAGLRLGAEILEAINGGRLALPFLVTLTGELGAGKTTLCQGLCRALGVEDPAEVISPTFTLANEYRGPVDVFHLDLYRLTEPEQFYEAGLEEYFSRPGLTLVEWPDRLPFRPERRLDLTLTFKDGGRLLAIGELSG